MKRLWRLGKTAIKAKSTVNATTKHLKHRWICKVKRLKRSPTVASLCTTWKRPVQMVQRSLGIILSRSIWLTKPQIGSFINSTSTKSKRVASELSKSFRVSISSHNSKIRSQHAWQHSQGSNYLLTVWSALDILSKWVLRLVSCGNRKYGSRCESV